MRRRLAIAGVLAAGRWAAGGDVPVPVSTAPAAVAPVLPVRFVVPPLVLPPADEPPATLPGGTPVSKPLVPVADPPPIAEPPPPAAVAAEPSGPLPKSWDRMDLLFWWAKAHPLPPLVTGSRVLAAPVLGGPNTVVLLGSRSLDNQDAAGGRFTLGWAVNEARTVGVEATYFFLGTRTYGRGVSDTADPRFPVLGRPVFNPNAGREDVVPVAYPGVGNGLVTATHTTRVTGWEVGGVGNVHAGPRATVNASVGYRYFMVNEGLRVEQNSLRFATAASPAILGATADQIDAHTRFHGAQVGLTAEFTRDGPYMEVGGKLAVGRAIEVVQVSGQGNLFVANAPLPLVIPTTGGVLGQPSNTGRTARAGFAVLPEAQLKLGYRFSDGSQVYVGYTFVYLSEAVRPGDQVDRTLRPSQTAFGPGPAAADRPELVVRSTDFWVQGIVFGLEWRY